MSATNYLYSSPDFLHYAAITTGTTGNLNLMALDPKGQNRLCRRILVRGPTVGTLAQLVVVRGDGTTVTLKVLPGVSEEIQVKTIIAGDAGAGTGTLGTEITVYW